MTERATSITDVAAAAKVSAGTVSNVLNRPEVVAPLTRARVLAAIAELGFVRNESARQLGAGSSNAVGLVVLNIGNPFFTDVARGVQELAVAQGMSLLIADSQEDLALERSHVDLFTRQRVKGLLVAPTGGPADWWDLTVAAGVPTVILDRTVRGLPAHSKVVVDDRAGAAAATVHLVERGHRRLAFIGGRPSLAQVKLRRSGIQAVVSATAGASLQVISTPGMTGDCGREAVAQLLTQPVSERPTAILAANDLVALGVLQGLLRAGVRVPQDIAVVGYDDIDFAAGAVVPLTSVRQPRRDLGRAAMELLLAEIGRRRAGTAPLHRTVRFQPSLVVRESTGGEDGREGHGPDLHSKPDEFHFSTTR